MHLWALACDTVMLAPNTVNVVLSSPSIIPWHPNRKRKLSNSFGSVLSIPFKYRLGSYIGSSSFLLREDHKKCKHQNASSWLNVTLP